MERTSRVLIVDDDRAVLRALTRLLRVHGFAVETFDSPGAFLERPRPDDTACVVLDLSMPGVSGLQVQQAVVRRGNDIPIIFLSGASDVPTAARAMRDGAVDFLVKPIDAGQLLAAVSEALARDAAGRERREQQRLANERLSLLTAREREVCQLVARGLQNKQIASELSIAEKTVKVHRGRAMQKLQLRSVADLVRLLAVLERVHGH